MLVKFPHQKEGRRVKGLVSHVDIFPTVMDLLQAQYPREWVDGQSLCQSWIDPNRVIYTRSPKRYLEGEKPTVAALMHDWKMISRKGKRYLFNLTNDPDEKVNLIGKVKVDELEDAFIKFTQRVDFLRYAKDDILIMRKMIFL